MTTPASLHKARALRTVRKTPVLMNALLRGVDAAGASAATDGPDGWSVLEILCHLRDFETIFLGRMTLAVDDDRPQFIDIDHLQLAVEGDYRAQNYDAVLADWHARRVKTLAYLEALADDAFDRIGVHARLGEMRVIDMALQLAMHDLDHMEQIARSLGLATAITS